MVTHRGWSGDPRTTQGGKLGDKCNVKTRNDQQLVREVPGAPREEFG